MKTRLLLLALAPDHFYRDPLLHGFEQRFIGPDVSTHSHGLLFGRAIRADLQDLSCRDLLGMLSNMQFQPDITFVKADASCRNHVRDIEFLPGRKVLLMGDTHHMKKPLQTMLAYAQSEPWDLISSEHDRHHLPLFVKAGLKQLIWLPCFTMNPHRLHPQLLVDIRPVFVGSLSHHHQQRQRLLAQLQSLGITLKFTTAPQVEAAKLYNCHSISLNVSLNGDLNFRIMEVLAAGGCLLTDRLGPDSGLDLLLAEGVHYLAYSSAAEAANKIQWLQGHPEERLAIARSGFDRFWTNFAPEVQGKALLAALNGRPFPELFRSPQ